MTNNDHPPVEKLRTGISSLDIIAKGGLPKNRTTLIKQLPPPLRRVIGDLSDQEKVLLGLEVRPGSSKPSATI